MKGKFKGGISSLGLGLSFDLYVDRELIFLICPVGIDCAAVLYESGNMQRYRDLDSGVYHVFGGVMSMMISSEHECRS
jgi:hypothetical protein